MDQHPECYAVGEPGEHRCHEPDKQGNQRKSWDRDFASSDARDNAAAAGLTVVVNDQPVLRLDLDRPEDLAEWALRLDRGGQG